MPVPVTLRGRGFVSTSRVDLNQPVAISDVRVIDSTTIEFTVPVGADAGRHTVTVTNPLPGGGTSNGVGFTVTNALAVLTALVPEGGLAAG